MYCEDVDVFIPRPCDTATHKQALLDRYGSLIATLRIGAMAHITDPVHAAMTERGQIVRTVGRVEEIQRGRAGRLVVCVAVGPLEPAGDVSGPIWTVGSPREGDELVRHGRTGAFTFNLAAIKDHSVAVAAAVVRHLESCYDVRERLPEIVATDRLGGTTPSIDSPTTMPWSLTAWASASASRRPAVVPPPSVRRVRERPGRSARGRRSASRR